MRRDTETNGQTGGQRESEIERERERKKKRKEDRKGGERKGKLEEEREHSWSTSMWGGGFLKIRSTTLGVPIIRIIISRGL